MKNSYVWIARCVCMFTCACLIANAAAATVSITIRVKNTDSVAHSFCIKVDSAGQFADTLAPGGTATLVKSLSDGQTVNVTWGYDQGAGSSNCTVGKDYDAMREDNGTTVYTVVYANGNQSTPYFELVKVSITTFFSATVNEGGSTTARITRTGSTSYALTVAFTTTGNATFSPSFDWSLYSDGNWVTSSVTIPSGVTSPTNGVDAILYAWSDGVGVAFDPNTERAGIALSTATNYLLGTSSSDTEIHN